MGPSLKGEMSALSKMLGLWHLHRMLALGGKKALQIRVRFQDVSLSPSGKNVHYLKED